MELRTYRAPTMSEALALVRRELGPDAAVLHTREVRKGRLFGLLSRQRMIEVTASREVNVPSLLSQQKPAHAVAPGNSFLPTYSRPRPTSPLRRAHVEPPTLPPSVSQQPMLPPGVNEKLTDLQTMVKELCRQSKSSNISELPEELFQVFIKLIDAEVSQDLARELVERLHYEARSELHDTSMLQARIVQMIEADIRAAGPIAITPGQSRTVALVGPTGVGKTTTIAKLAAHYRLKEKRRLGLITVDTYRIAAVEQLRTYAHIINLPMQVVSTLGEMREAVGRMADMDLVLIDTAGRSPKDEVRLKELKAFLKEASADEVHLVLSSAASARALEQTAERFAAVGTTALILTKLDEAHGLGNVLPVLRSSRLPVSYLTNGQNVPDDIEVAQPSHLARLILGLDGLS